MNEIQFDYSQYNEKLWEKIQKLYNVLKNGNMNPVLYQYDWDSAEAIEIDPKKNESFNEQTINYYWIEFEGNNEKYKISAFYKDYDMSSGNVHVIPGVLQWWKCIDINLADLSFFGRLVSGKGECRCFKELIYYHDSVTYKPECKCWEGTGADDTRQYLTGLLENLFKNERDEILEINKALENKLKENYKNVETEIEKYINIKFPLLKKFIRMPSTKENSKGYHLVKYLNITIEGKKRSLMVQDHKIFFDRYGNPYSKYGEIQILLKDMKLGKNTRMGGPNKYVYENEERTMMCYPYHLPSGEEKYPVTESGEHRVFSIDKIDEALNVWR